MSTPKFLQTVNCSRFEITTAENVASPVPSSPVGPWTAGASGGKIRYVEVTVRGGNTATKVWVWQKSGSSYYKIADIPIAAQSSSTTAQVWPYRYDLNRYFGAGVEVYFSATNAAGGSVSPAMQVFVDGGDF